MSHNQPTLDQPPLDQPAMSLGPLYVWRHGWPLPPVATRIEGRLTVESTPPPGPLGNVPAAEVVGRLATGHALFTARLDGDLAAYGWSASERAHIGGLDLHLAIPPGERYLWDFETLSTYRGRGLYPLLLQAILRRQSDVAGWFWIGHEPANESSRRGILKAGFRVAGHIWRLPDASLAVVGAPDFAAPDAGAPDGAGPALSDPAGAAPDGADEAARHAAALLGLRLLPAPPDRP